MHFQNLPNELVLHIFQSCFSIKDVLHMAATCQHFRNVFAASPRKLDILFQAAENDFGPIHDAIQVITQNSSQPAYLTRTAPISMALLKQLIELGSVAKKWEEIYPSKKWKHNYEDRRLLTSTERFCLRRAVYRLWLYSRAFHNARYPRTSRNHRHNILERAELLHNWSTVDLAEMEDMREIMRDVIQNHICPSNGTIQRKFHKRFPESGQQLLFNIHLNYPPPSSAFQAHFHSAHQISANLHTLKYQSTRCHEPGSEGWGDDIPHYYVVEDMLKLDPGQLIWLKENAPLKGMVEAFTKSLGEWFDNNGSTFGQTLDSVIVERGLDIEEFREEIRDEEAGIV